MRAHVLSVTLLALLPLACATSSETSGGPSQNRSLITAEELATLPSVSLYEAVQRLRPAWLRSRGPVSSRAANISYPHVFLVGMEEELLPHKSSIEEENIEEERRLAYVGITRAQRTLTISYAEKRKRFGEVVNCEPSRFLNELPPDDLIWEARGTPLSKEEKQERGTAHLASMKALLGD